MSRMKCVNGESVPFTSAEEAQWDAMEEAAKLPAALDAFKATRDGCLAAGKVHDGHRWHSDKDGQSSISSAVVLAQVVEAHGGTFTTTWKTMDGPIQVNLAQLVAAGLAVGSHVQAAFKREAELIAKAKSGNVTGAMAEIGQGWPEDGE